MSTFMLWFDNSKAALAEKVRQAAAYYQKKYGRAPELCLVPVSLAEEVGKEMQVDGIAVRVWHGALPFHLCLGVEDAPVLVEEVGA